MSELARFTITGGTEPTDKVAVTVDAGGLPDLGFNVVEHRVDGTRVAVGWWQAAAPAVTYAAQFAGWPVKSCEWSEVGHSQYWPSNQVEGRVRVPAVVGVGGL